MMEPERNIVGASPTASVTVGDYGQLHNPARSASEHGAMPPTGVSRQPHTKTEEDESWEVYDARPILPKASFFMGDLRDGIPMLNMQTAFLMSAKGFEEKQIGILFAVFGVSQVLTLMPAGYLLDYSHHKIRWVISGSVVTSAMTVLTTVIAKPNGENLALLIVLKFIQGCFTALLPPGFNGITLGIVGSTGFTLQVSRNKMMSHLGTSLVVSIGSLIAYFLYPNIGLLFVASPVACIGLVYYLRRIKPDQVHTDAARNLVITSPTMTDYETMDEENELLSDVIAANRKQSGEGSLDPESSFCGGCALGYVPPNVLAANAGESISNTNGNLTTDLTSEAESGGREDRKQSAWYHREGAGRVELTTANSTSSASQHSYDTTPRDVPSFNFGLYPAESSGDEESNRKPHRRAQTPLAVLMDRTLLIFTAVVFFFHLSNSSVLPLVMQSLPVEDPQNGILLSGLCILIGQLFMSYFAKICGDFTPIWGRKRLFLAGLFSLPLRCFLLSLLDAAQENVETASGQNILTGLALSTQLLDSVGAGILGTLYILVTNDIGGGTGRFSLMLGMTTSAMCLGGTVSGYIGQSLAQDYGYGVAFTTLGFMSLVPAFLYLFLMPETLPDYAKPKPKKRRLTALLSRLNKKTSSLTSKNSIFKSKKRVLFEQRQQSDPTMEGVDRTNANDSQL